MRYFVVETVNTFHHKYLIAQPDDHKPEWCMDTVTCNEVDDLYQKHLGESIIGYKEASDEDIRDIAKDTYYASWCVPQIKEVFAKVVNDD